MSILFHKIQETRARAMQKSQGDIKNAISQLQQDSVAQHREMLGAISAGPAHMAVKSISEPSFKQPFRLSVSTAPKFLPRTDVTQLLEQALQPNTNPSRRKVFVLHGLGGIGKTQVAIDFARQSKASFDSIFFVDGRTEKNLTSSLASHADCVQHPLALYSGSTSGSMKIRSADEIRAHIKRFLDWLSLSNNRRWLLIFDNVDSLPWIPGGFDLAQFFPAADHGSILITTRLASLDSLGLSHKLGKMDALQSLQLFNLYLNSSSSSAQQSGCHQDSPLDALLSKLDGVPLAIVQAACFISKLGIGIPLYLQLYESNQDKLTKFCSYGGTADSWGTIRNTWTLSYEQLIQEQDTAERTEQYKKAAMFLQLWSYLDCREIWYELLQMGVYVNDAPLWFQEVMASPLTFLETMGVLLDFSLIDRVENGSFAMNSVVHDWSGRYLLSKPDPDMLRVATTAVGVQTALRTLLACRNSFGQQDEDASAMDGLYYFQLASIQYWNGDYQSAVKTLENALEVLRTSLNPGAPWTLRALNLKAMAKADLRDYESANQIWEEIIQHSGSLQREADNFTLSVYASLGRNYSKLRRASDSRQLLTKLLGIHEQDTGADNFQALQLCTLLSSSHRTQ
ncbi:hypothetical protein SLS54_004711, partial [Diplodia seriata]